jgi:hypothetical protein
MQIISVLFTAIFIVGCSGHGYVRSDVFPELAQGLADMKINSYQSRCHAREGYRSRIEIEERRGDPTWRLPSREVYLDMQCR